MTGNNEKGPQMILYSYLVGFAAFFKTWLLLAFDLAYTGTIFVVHSKYKTNENNVSKYLESVQINKLNIFYTPSSHRR